MSKVILVDQQDHVLGEMDKMEAHRLGVLHRAFSIFIFNQQGEMLIHQRALEKYHSGGLWTNACCSHPQPGEKIGEAAARRLTEEMGFTADLHPAFHFTYKASLENGLTEHEFDHVLIGRYEDDVIPNPDEVMDYRFISLGDLRSSMHAEPGKFTEWFKIAFPKLEAYLANLPQQNLWIEGRSSSLAAE